MDPSSWTQRRVAHPFDVTVVHIPEPSNGVCQYSIRYGVVQSSSLARCIADESFKSSMDVNSVGRPHDLAFRSKSPDKESPDIVSNPSELCLNGRAAQICTTGL